MWFKDKPEGEGSPRRKFWDRILGKTPEERAELRKQEVLTELGQALSDWPGLVSVTPSDRKIKVVLDDEGVGLCVMVWVDVAPVELSALREQAERRKKAREKFKDPEAPEPVVGTLRLRVNEETLARILSGGKTDGS